MNTACQIESQTVFIYQNDFQTDFFSKTTFKSIFHVYMISVSFDFSALFK